MCVRVREKEREKDGRKEGTAVECAERGGEKGGMTNAVRRRRARTTRTKEGAKKVVADLAK